MAGSVYDEARATAPSQFYRAGVGVLLGCGLLMGCGGRRHVSTLEQLPVTINPGGGEWGVEVGIEMSDVIRVQLVNTSEEPVRAVWEESAYIDVDGESHPVMAWGGGGKPRRRTQAPLTRTLVAPGSRIDMVLLPHGEGPKSGGIHSWVLDHVENPGRRPGRTAGRCACSWCLSGTESRRRSRLPTP
jgi:hypothetical protein